MTTHAEKSFKTYSWVLTSINMIICEYFHIRLFHNRLSQNHEHKYMYEYNLYIGDVKVSSEGRC